MAQLEKIDLGAPGSGVGGDSPRSANDRVNRNVDILNRQTTLVSTPAITSPQALTPAHMGKRVNINLGSAGTIKFPPANTCGADQVTLLRNLSQFPVMLAVADNSGDTLSLQRLGAFESALIDCNGDKAWGVLMRGRPASDNESVAGGLSVGGDLSVGGRLCATNSANLLVNSSGELRNQCWSGTNFGWLNGSIGEGTMFINSAPISTSGYVMDTSDNIPCASGVQLCLSAEVATGGLNAGQVYMKLEAFNSSNALLATFAFSPITTKRDYMLSTVTGKTPNGTAYVRVCRVADNAPNVAQWGVAFRRIKLERGMSPSLYSQEASILYLQGTPDYSGRPTYAGKVPWDSGNFNPAGYAALSGAKFSGSVYVNSGGPNVGGSRVVVGSSGPEWPVEFNNSYTGSSGAGVMLMQACSTATQFAQFFYFSTIVGSITHNGSSVSYNTASDYRLKENIMPLAGATERLMKMKPSRFNFISDPSKTEVDGFIAHELQAVTPYAVTGEKDAVEYIPLFGRDFDPEDVQPEDVDGVSEVIVPQTVDHSKLVPLLTAALMETVKRVDELEAKVGS